ncbi:MAG: hypothetical protein PHQ74_07265 [Crocinitomicaceae bacterium]|nr:hypothetical protein [Crocinitomicaceae bacterium]
MVEELNEIDSLQIQQISAEIGKVRKTIQENYLNDTLTVELGQALEDYKLAGKQAIWVTKNLSIAYRTNLETQERIKNLRLDILAGNGERDKYDSYLKSEEEQVSDLEKLHQTLLKNSEESIQNYQELNQKMVTYSKRNILNNTTL